jgi:hypothetical protein
LLALAWGLRHCPLAEAGQWRPGHSATHTFKPLPDLHASMYTHCAETPSIPCLQIYPPPPPAPLPPPPSTPPSPPYNPLYISPQSSYTYSYVAEPAPYYDALAACQAMGPGGTLVQYPSLSRQYEVEDVFVRRGVLQESVRPTYWMGLRIFTFDFWPNFTWVNGRSLGNGAYEHWGTFKVGRWRLSINACAAASIGTHSLPVRSHPPTTVALPQHGSVQAAATSHPSTCTLAAAVWLKDQDPVHLTLATLKPPAPLPHRLTPRAQQHFPPRGLCLRQLQPDLRQGLGLVRRPLQQPYAVHVRAAAHALAAPPPRPAGSQPRLRCHQRRQHDQWAALCVQQHAAGLLQLAGGVREAGRQPCGV